MGKTTEETGNKVKRKDTDKKSQAKAIEYCIYKQKEWLKTHKKIRNLKEPVLFFERRTGDTEIYESATSGLFEYKHSDGNTRFIIINPRDQKRLGWGNNAFRYYWGHEDYPTTGRQEPLITAEQMNTIVEKSLQDMQKYKAQIEKYKGKWILWVAIAIVLVLMGYGLMNLLLPNTVTPQQAIQAGQQAIGNITPTIV